MDGLNDFLFVTTRALRARAFNLLAGSDTFVLHARKNSRIDRSGDGWNCHSLVQRLLRSPFSGAFLLSFVEHEVDKRLTGLFVSMSEDVRGDFNEKRLERPAIPFREYVGKLGRVEAQSRAKNVVSFRDQLHIAVLDSVVHHLDEMARAVRANVRDAGTRVSLCGDGFENRANVFVSFASAARHQRRSVPSAFFAARDARSDEAQTVFAKRFFATLCIPKVRVSAVDEYVALFKQGFDSLDCHIDRRARLDHHHHSARPLQRAHEFFNGPCAGESLALILADKAVYPFGFEVPNRDREAVLLDVQGKIAAHHREPNHSELRLLSSYSFAGYHKSPIWAGTLWPPLGAQASLPASSLRLHHAGRMPALPGAATEDRPYN